MTAIPASAVPVRPTPPPQAISTSGRKGAGERMGTVETTDNVIKIRIRKEFVQCRTYGHAWNEFNPTDSPSKPWAEHWRITLRCTCCTTER